MKRTESGLASIQSVSPSAEVNLPPTVVVSAHWTIPKIIVFILILAHLVWVALGAAHLGPPRGTVFSKALAHYSTLSGTGTGFGYFSPEITSELRGRFEILDGNGRRAADSLEAGLTREGLLRAKIVIGSIAESIDDKATRQLIAGHWAEKIFARHPDAHRVTAVIEEYQLPSLREYPRNPTVGWRPFYRVAFEEAR